MRWWLSLLRSLSSIGLWDRLRLITLMAFTNCGVRVWLIVLRRSFSTSNWQISNVNMFRNYKSEIHTQSLFFFILRRAFIPIFILHSNLVECICSKGKGATERNTIQLALPGRLPHDACREKKNLTSDKDFRTCCKYKIYPLGCILTFPLGDLGRSLTEPQPKAHGNPTETSKMGPNLTGKLGKDGKLTPAERQHHMENNLCLFCGKTGHLAKDCSKVLSAGKARATATAPEPTTITKVKTE